VTRQERQHAGKRNEHRSGGFAAFEHFASNESMATRFSVERFSPLKQLAPRGPCLGTKHDNDLP
jgi:hypothetical protein